MWAHVRFHSSTRRLRLALVVVLWGASLACAPAAPEDSAGTPQAAVREFYRLLNDGAFDQAKALYGREAAEALSGGDADAAFREWAKSETHEGGIAEVEIVNSEVEENSATIEFELHYTDGASRQGTVSLDRESDGTWKLGMIG